MGLRCPMMQETSIFEDQAQTSLPIDVHPADLDISDQGISGFDWPYSHEEMVAFGGTLEYALADLLSNFPDQSIALAYKIAAKNFVLSVATCFMGEVLVSRLKARGQTLNLPEDWKIWSAFLKDSAPPAPFYLDQIKKHKTASVAPASKHFASLKSTISLLRRATLGVRGIKFDGLYLPQYSLPAPKNVIFATQRLSLIAEHSKIVREPVYLCSSTRFFAPISESDIDKNSPADVLHDKVMGVVHMSFAAHGMKARTHIVSYLDDALKKYVCLIRIHMQRLEDMPDLPRRLWTGTGGNLWDVMLRCAVRKCGGEVVAHDHGGGVPQLNHPEKGWIEMWSCDKFICYGEEQAKTFKMFMKQWPCLDKVLPAVEGLQSTTVSGKIKEFLKFKEKDFSIKSIRIFSTVYSSEDGRGLPLYPHIPYIDWQSRLIGRLKNMGYDITFRPHPDSSLLPPPAYEEKLGAKIINIPFNQMDQNFDLYIFDLSNTSVLQTALLTNKPVLIIDFGIYEWRADAKELLQQRCGFIQGHYNGSRMMINWDELDQQIKKSARLCNNHAFAEKYYL